jgi:hypothetical protein
MILLNISFKYKFINKMRCGETVESLGGSGSIPTFNCSDGGGGSNEGTDSFAFGIIGNPVNFVFFGDGDIMTNGKTGGDRLDDLTDGSVINDDPSGSALLDGGVINDDPSGSAFLDGGVINDDPSGSALLDGGVINVVNGGFGFGFGFAPPSCVKSVKSEM